MISAVVLAAGSSRRMGSPKSLLKIGEKTFLQHIVDVLHSSCVLDIAVVLGAGAEEIKKNLTWFTGKIVVNANWEKGQISSIVAGLDSLVSKDVDGVMICPVDHPLITHPLVVDLLQAFWKSKKKIIVPVFQGQRGHPVIFEQCLFDELRSAPLDVGARALVHAHPDDVMEVPTSVEGVLTNIDTLADYRAKMPKQTAESA